MTFRLLLAFAILLLPTSGHAMECVSKTYGSARIDHNPDCGSLKQVEKRRDDPRPNLVIDASYVRFDPPVTDAERRFNDWLEGQVRSVPFEGAIELGRDDRFEYRFSVNSLYRSPRLLSATTSVWICCGAHGTTGIVSVNIDARTGRYVMLGELLDLRAVSSYCWEAFSHRAESGEAFAERYPKKDFVVANSWDGWAAEDSGITIHSGELLGYASGPFWCTLSTGELPRFTKSGVTVPF